METSNPLIEMGLLVTVFTVTLYFTVTSLTCLLDELAAGVFQVIDKREGCSALLLDRSFGFDLIHYP